MPPLVSVLIPARNAAAYIQDALWSVLTQSLTDFEVVLVDNGSTDGTVTVATGVGDRRVRVLTCPEPGIVPTLNTGLQACRGRYIARMDADDWSTPDRLEKQVAALESDGSLLAVGSWFRIVDDQRRVQRVIQIPDDLEEIRRRLFVRNPFAHGSLCFRAGPHLSYSASVPLAEDYELLCTLAWAGRIGVVEEALYDWRSHAGNSTADARARRRAGRAVRDRLWAQRRPAPVSIPTLRRRVHQGHHQPPAARFVARTEAGIALEMLTRHRFVAAARQTVAVASVARAIRGT